MHLDQPFRQCQSQPGALLLPAIRRVHLLELGENPLLVLRLDTDAGVGHGHFQTLARERELRSRGRICIRVVLHRGGHDHLPAVRGELDGVAEQVVHDLLELRLVGAQQRKIGGRFEIQLDVFLLASALTMAITSRTAFATLNEVRASSMCPASTLDKSRMSLISWRRWRPLLRMFFEYLSWRSFKSPKSLSARISEKPMMALSGVRH